MAVIGLVLLIVAVFLVVAMSEFTAEAAELALKTDLRRIRSAVALHYSKTNTYPRTIEELSPPKSGAGIGLILHDVDKRGRARDPFGRRYSYDPATGRVHSTTPGYEHY
jgi:hypothetical protein